MDTHITNVVGQLPQAGDLLGLDKYQVHVLSKWFSSPVDKAQNMAGAALIMPRPLYAILEDAVESRKTERQRMLSFTTLSSSLRTCFFVWGSLAFRDMTIYPHERDYFELRWDAMVNVFGSTSLTPKWPRVYAPHFGSRSGAGFPAGWLKPLMEWCVDKGSAWITKRDLMKYTGVKRCSADAMMEFMLQNADATKVGGGGWYRLKWAEKELSIIAEARRAGSAGPSSPRYRVGFDRIVTPAYKGMAQTP